MSIHTYTGLNLQLAGHGRAFDMGNLVHRRAAALAIQSVGGANFSNELISGLSKRPGTLTPELREEFDRITSNSPEFSDVLVTSLKSLLRREPAANGLTFVATHGSMHEYLRASGIGPKEQLPGITEGAVREWGTYQGQETKNFREPKTLRVAQAVALHADKVAMGEGLRVDPLEFAGHIYPELRVMLEEATQAGNYVYVKPPVFMAHIPFKDHTFQKFASGLANSGLAKRIGGDVGVAIERLQAYVSDKSAKITPYVSTLREISRAIAYDALAAEDGQYAREVFRYLIVLRLRDFLTTEEGGKLRSLVPIVGKDADPAIYTTSKDVASRYSIVVNPDERALYGSGEASKHARRLRWIDRIMSSEYDNRISEWEQRLNGFDAFEGLVATHHNGRRINLREMRVRFNRFKGWHSRYKKRLIKADGAHDALTHEEVAERASFYSKLERAFRQAMYFTHVRGKVVRDGRSISFEIVSQPNARSAAKIPSGFVPVYGGDVFAQDWNEKRQEALVTLRAIRGYLARTGQLSDSEAHFAEEALSFYWPAHLLGDFGQVLEDMRELGGQDLFNGRGGPKLPMSRSGSQETIAQPAFYLYDSGYARAVPQDGETKLQAMVRTFYARIERSIFAKGDAWVIEQYLSAVRYPHYVYDPDLLASLIAQAHTTGPSHDAARRRIERLFGAHSIKNERAYAREQAGQRKVTVRTLTDQAFADYRRFFSASVSHGLEIPTEEDLVVQIAEGLLAQHSMDDAAKRRVVQGVYDSIGQYNRALCSDARRLPDHTLLQRGLFDSRFDRFANAWQARSGGRELPLDRRILISGAQSLMSMATGVEDVFPAAIQHEVEMVAGDATPAQIADAVSFITSWLKRQRRDVDLMSRMLSNDTYGIEAFMGTDGQRYGSPMIPTRDISLLAVRAIRRRISVSGELDGRAEALDVLNDRFEFLPQVREQAAMFMQAAAAHYLKWLRASLGLELNNMVEALELMEDGEHPEAGHNAFVRDLAEIADSSVPTNIVKGEFPSLRAVERIQRVSGELTTGTMRSAIGLSDRVSSIVRRNREKTRAEQKEIEKLKAALREKVERIQRAYDRGVAELASASREVVDLMVSRAEAVSGQIAGFGSRVPEGDHVHRSDAALRRIGRVAHSGAGWVTQELNLNSGSGPISLVRLVSNLQTYVVGSDFSPWADRLSAVDDRLVEQGLRFEETRDAVKAEQDRRAKAEADENARAAIALAKREVARLRSLITPSKLIERFDGLMTRLDGVESQSVDYHSFVSELASHASDRRQARQLIRVIEGRVALIVQGIEADYQPSLVISAASKAGSQAYSMKDSANAAAEEVLEAWSAVREEAEALTEKRRRILAALETARHRLSNAERNLPAATDIDMTAINSVNSRIRRVVERDAAKVRLYMAQPLTKKQAPQAIDAMDAHARTTAILSVNGRGFLLEMDDANQRSFNAWRDGGRKGDLILASINGRDVVVPEGSRPVYTTSVSKLPKDHPLGRMVEHFASLKGNTSARAFVAWVDRYRRDGNVIAIQIWDQIIARLADPKLKTGDVANAIAGVAAAMRPDIRMIDSSLNWVDIVTQYTPVTRPMFADERRLLAGKNSAELDDKMMLRAGGRRAVVHTMPNFINAVEHGTILPKDPARLILWRALRKNSRGPVVRGITSAAALWSLIERAERDGHPHAGALRYRLLNRLKAVMFPRGIKPNSVSNAIDGYANDIARTSELFYLEFYVELEHPRLIHDESLGYGLARHQSVGASVAKAMGFAEGTLASQLISTIFENNCYLPSGYALWRVFGSDSSQEQRDAVRVIFRKYGAYGLDESEPLSIHWMLEEMQDALVTVERTVREGRPLPAWWTTPADAELAGQAPEIASVSWFRIDHTVRPDDSRDPRAPIHNAAHRFIQLYPEFAGAVTIVETLRQVMRADEHPFLVGFIALYDQVAEHEHANDFDGQRDRLAALFRDLYLSSLDLMREALGKQIQGEGSLGGMLSIDRVMPRVSRTRRRIGLSGGGGGSFDAAIDRIFRGSSK